MADHNDNGGEWTCLHCGTRHEDKQAARDHAEHSMQGVVPVRLVEGDA